MQLISSKQQRKKSQSWTWKWRTLWVRVRAAARMQAVQTNRPMDRSHRDLLLPTMQELELVPLRPHPARRRRILLVIPAWHSSPSRRVTTPFRFNLATLCWETHCIVISNSVVLFIKLRWTDEQRERGNEVVQGNARTEPPVALASRVRKQSEYFTAFVDEHAFESSHRTPAIRKTLPRGLPWSSKFPPNSLPAKQSNQSLSVHRTSLARSDSLH